MTAYELRDIHADSPYATSSSGRPYTVGIFDGPRMIFRFCSYALRPSASGASFADQCLTRLQNPRESC